MTKIKIASTNVRIENELLKVVEQEIEGDFGKKKRILIDREPVVLIFPVTPEYDIYLTSQYRYNHGKKIIDAVAGYIDQGEEAFDAAVRELKEESGITAGKIEKISEVEVGAGVLKGKIHIYYAKDLDFGDTEFNEDEEIELIKISLDEAVEKVMKGEITISACCLGILMLDKLRKEGNL